MRAKRIGLVSLAKAYFNEDKIMKTNKLRLAVSLVLIYGTTLGSAYGQTNPTSANDRKSSYDSRIKNSQ